jgi:purine-binding chemotaxis protein CheW
VQLVVFSLTGDEYALPIERVQEVIPYRTPRSIGHPLPWVVGVIDLRGTILPVCDLATRLAMPLPSREHQKIVVVESRGALAGLVVDQVHEVATVEPAQLAQPPAVAAEFVQAIAALGRLVLVLDVDGVLKGLGPKEPPAPPPRRSLAELRGLAAEAGIPGRSRMTREQLLAVLGLQQ